MRLIYKCIRINFGHVLKLLDKERKMPMYTVKSLVHQLTAPKVVLQNVCDTLRKIDPSYAQEEQKYNHTVTELNDAIGEAGSPSVGEYLAATEQKLCAELIYITWLGFRQNLECFQNPVNNRFLELDYEDIHREHRLHTLPEVQKSLKTIDAFHKMLFKLPEAKHSLTNGVTDYVCYLEAVGYKLAHYFGFILADAFLGYVIPGYVSDPCTTIRYTMVLENYMQLDLSTLVDGMVKEVPNI